MNIQNNITKALEAIKNADALLITTGAGMGEDSGLPDFRKNEDILTKYPTIAKRYKSSAELANPSLFIENPRLAWAFYSYHLNLYRSTNPHKGFIDLLTIAEQKKGGYFVVTSNVDGQFQKAGYNTDKIEECHGSIQHLQCSKPCCSKIWDANKVQLSIDTTAFAATGPLPYCEDCGSIARPNILMFGDASWIHNRTENQSLRFEQWIKEKSDHKHQLAIIELGAANAAPTIKWISQNIAKQYNATLIRINPIEYNVVGNNISIPMGAAEAIEALYSKL